jgi:hypothetical protein
LGNPIVIGTNGSERFMEAHRVQHEITAVLRSLSAWLQQIFYFPKTTQAKRINQFWLICLYLGGIALFGAFFNWGNIPNDFHDWSDITAPRFTFQQDAITHGKWPLHISDKSTVGGATDRFLSIPDLVLSPQIFLLSFMDTGVFSLVNILILYSFGFLAWVHIQRKAYLSSIAFTIAFLLFNFNGHILAHLSVGHITWGGYFLFPWFVILILSFSEGCRSWKWVAQMAGLLFIIFIQGSYHQFVWCLFFLGFLSIIHLKKNWPAFFAAVFAVLLSMIRIWPCSLAASSFESRFHGGFRGLSDIWNALTTIQIPGAYLKSPIFFQPVGWWELTIYIGLAGTVFLIYFGIYRWLRDRKSIFTYHELIFPISGLILLSFSVVFNWLHQIPFPLLTGERVSSRMISLPFVFLLVLAVIQFQRWIDKKEQVKWFEQLVILAGIIIISINLWGNYQTWGVLKAYQVFPHELFKATDWFVANRYDDWQYLQAIRRGGLVSLIGAALLGGFIWLEKMKNKYLVSIKNNPDTHHKHPLLHEKVLIVLWINCFGLTRAPKPKKGVHK